MGILSAFIFRAKIYVIIVNISHDEWFVFMLSLDGDLDMLFDGEDAVASSGVAGSDFLAVNLPAVGSDVDMPPDGGVTVSDLEDIDLSVGSGDRFLDHLADDGGIDYSGASLNGFLPDIARPGEPDEVKAGNGEGLDGVELSSVRSLSAGVMVPTAADGGAGSVVGDSVVDATLHRGAVLLAAKAGNAAVLERQLASCAQKHYLSFDRGLLHQESDSEEKRYVLAILRYGTCARRVEIVGHYWLNFKYLNKIWLDGWPVGLKAGINGLWADAWQSYQKLRSKAAGKVNSGLPKPTGSVDSAEVKTVTQQWVKYILGRSGQARWDAVAELLKGGASYRGLLTAVYQAYLKKDKQCLVVAYIMGQSTLEARLGAVRSVIMSHICMMINAVLKQVVSLRKKHTSVFGELGDVERRNQAERAVLVACFRSVRPSITLKNQLAWAYGLDDLQMRSLPPLVGKHSGKVRAFLTGYPEFLDSIDPRTGQPIWRKRRAGSKRVRPATKDFPDRPAGAANLKSVKKAASQWVSCIQRRSGHARWAAVTALLTGCWYCRGLVEAVYRTYPKSRGQCLAVAYIMGQLTFETRLAAVAKVLATSVSTMINAMLKKIIAFQRAPSNRFFAGLGNAEAKKEAEQKLCVVYLQNNQARKTLKNQLLQSCGLRPADLKSMLPPVAECSNVVQKFLKGYAKPDAKPIRPKKAADSKRQHKEVPPVTPPASKRARRSSARLALAVFKQSNESSRGGRSDAMPSQA